MAGSARKPRFPELPPKYSSSRELRNKAEKIRRDRLNKLIEEMRSLVPMICNKTKKSDTTRSTILRLTANFLRVTRLFPQDANSEVANTSEQSFLAEGLPHLESMDGFFFILAEDGRVLYISENVDKFVGFSQIDMMGFPIYNFTHPADQSKLQSNLSKKDQPSPCPSPQHNLPATSPPHVPASYSSSNSHTLALPSSYQANCEEKGPRQSFYIRLLQKPLAKHDNPQYEHMHVVGHLRQTDNMDDRNNCVSQNTFIGVMRPVRDRPITELSLMESIQDQYLTRHLPDGRIIYTDHRISTIAGYLPSEVKGKSAFNFFYAEDLPWTTMAMRHMFASSNGEGSTVYRLFTQTGELICLQTKGFLEFNKSTNKIESFLCINTLIRPEDADRYLNEQKERFTPFITEVQINKMAAGNQSSPSTLPLQSSQEGSQPSVLQLLSSSAEVSVIAKSSMPASKRNSLPKDSSLKRQFLQISSDAPQYRDSYQCREGPPTKKSVAPQSISNIQISHKRKLDQLDDTQQKLPSSKVPPNWQYTPARGEPTHRTEEGIRVVDIEQQFFPEDNSHTPGYKQEDNQIDFQGLINQLNEAHKFKHSQDSNTPGFVAEHSSQNHPRHSQLTDTGNQILTNSDPGPRRVGSVIRMLPQRKKIVENSLTSLESNDEHKQPFSLDNPLDTEVFLPDYLSPLSTNQQTINSNLLLADVIKEEMLHSSSSEAERIADKLKVMLAPLSVHQDRQDQRQCSDMTGVQGVTYPNNQNQSNSDPDTSDLFEILNQDLMFSLDSCHNDQKLLSTRKDQVPSTSS